jgi:hypothetical protein
MSPSADSGPLVGRMMLNWSLTRECEDFRGMLHRTPEGAHKCARRSDGDREMTLARQRPCYDNELRAARARPRWGFPR